MVDMSVNIGGLRLSNPVMPGSGTFAEGMARVLDLNRLGAIVTKTFTPHIREGCKPPRVVEYKDASLMAIGIPSKGPQHYIREVVPLYRDCTAPLVASISAPTVEDFARLAAMVSVEGVRALEINVSCPNLEKDGKAFSMEPDATARVVAAIRATTPLPIWAKLTPNVTDIAQIALAAERAGADAVTVCNGMLGMAVDIENFRPALGNITGGVTGPALKPVILRMCWQVAQATGIPVIGCGGIATAEDAIEYMMAGASAVQVGTANFIHPRAMLDVIDGIRAFCLRKGLTRASDLTGAMRTEGFGGDSAGTELQVS
ncbi:dihydroorotate dehydrogenase [Paracoccus sp. (in: a-proteobacteria)]|uniref:dihydroorotate dehydrogenase n=1 Tax=Paracoccus sp. TaxID=267 RepID=UPI003A886A57